MSEAIQNLMFAVEEAASERNHEVIAAIMNIPDLDRCCCYSRVDWRIRSLEKRIYKVGLRIEAKEQGMHPRYIRREQRYHEKLSLDALEYLKDYLTKEAQKDRIHLHNLDRCGTCPGCKYTPPKMRAVINPVDFSVRFIIDDWNHLSE